MTIIVMQNFWSKKYTMEIEHISFSDLTSYYNCGWLYYLDKLNPMYTTNYSAEVGSYLHTAIDMYYTDSENFQNNFLTHIEKEILNYSSERLRFQIVSDLDIITKWIFSIVPKYVYDFKNKYPNIQVFETSGFENKIYEPIKDLNIRFKGYIDHLFYETIDDNRMKIYIFDFKTSKEWWTDYTKNDLMKKSQLGYYKYFIAQKLIRQQITDFEIETKFINFKLFSNEYKIYNVDFNKDEMNQIIKTLRNTINGIKNDLFINSSNHCKLCNRTDCTKRKYENVYF